MTIEASTPKTRPRTSAGRRLGEVRLGRDRRDRVGRARPRSRSRSRSGSRRRRRPWRRSIPSSQPRAGERRRHRPEHEQATLRDPPPRPRPAEPAQPEDADDDPDAERDRRRPPSCSGSRPTVTASDGPSTPSTLATDVAVASSTIGRLIDGSRRTTREAVAQLGDRLAEGSTSLAGLGCDRRRARQPDTGDARSDVEGGDDRRARTTARPVVTINGPRNAKPTANEPWSVRLKTLIAVSSWALGTTRGIIEPSAGVKRHAHQAHPEVERPAPSGCSRRPARGRRSARSGRGSGRRAPSAGRVDRR